MSDLGEAIAASMSSADDWQFAIRLRKVTFDSGVTVTLGAANVTGPHWQDAQNMRHAWGEDARRCGLPADGPWSRKPVAIPLSAVSKPVKVEVEITKSKNVSGSATLMGSLGGLQLTGTLSSLSTGTHTVETRLVEPPETVACARGSMAWGLEIPSRAITYALGSTWLEVYFLLAPPLRPFHRELPAEVLRFVFGHLDVDGRRDHTAIVRVITRGCHQRLGFRYDVWSGGPEYVNSWGGGLFNVSGYMRRTSREVNCYDQASAVQSFAAALGVPVTYLFLEPFGYIRPMALVGWPGLCNNPFFGDDVRMQLVDRDHPARTSFGNHAFGEVAGLVADACGGPYPAAGDRRAYLRATVDPRDDDGGTPGTVRQIITPSGVTDFA